MAKQTVSSENYQTVFGKKPVGVGVWSFEIAGHGVSAPAKMMFSEAKSWAIQYALECHGGVVEIDVLRKDQEVRCQEPAEPVVATEEVVIDAAVAPVEEMTGMAAAEKVTVVPVSSIEFGSDCHPLVLAVRRHAAKIGKRGWETVSSDWSDSTILEVVGNCKSEKSAIAKVAMVVLAEWWSARQAKKVA